MKVKTESEVAESCPTLRDPMDCGPPGSSIHGIFQARVLEWGAIAFSKGSSTSYLKQLSIPVRPAPESTVIRPVLRSCTRGPAPGTGREGVDRAYLKGQEVAGRGGSRKNRIAGSTHHLPKNTKALGSLSSYPDTSQAKETKEPCAQLSLKLFVDLVRGAQEKAEKFPDYDSSNSFQCRLIVKKIWAVCVCVSVNCSGVSDSVTLCIIACQAPLSVGFSRQEHWSGLPFPPPGIFPTQG